MQPSEFWATPLPVFMAMLNRSATKAEKRRNRKHVINSMRLARQKFGWQ